MITYYEAMLFEPPKHVLVAGYGEKVLYLRPEDEAEYEFSYWNSYHGEGNRITDCRKSDAIIKEVFDR
jgi:hypothetical protein